MILGGEGSSTKPKAENTRKEVVSKIEKVL